MVVGATDRAQRDARVGDARKAHLAAKGGSNAPQRRADSPTSEITRTRDRRKLRDVALAAEGHRQRRVRGARDGTSAASGRTQTGAAAPGSPSAGQLECAASSLCGADDAYLLEDRVAARSSPFCGDAGGGPRAARQSRRGWVSDGRVHRTVSLKRVSPRVPMMRTVWSSVVHLTTPRIAGCPAKVP